MLGNIFLVPYKKKLNNLGVKQIYHDPTLSYNPVSSVSQKTLMLHYAGSHDSTF
jgi:hypothetical protein